MSNRIAKQGKQEVLTPAERKAIKKLVAEKIVSVQEKKSFDTGFGSTVDNTGVVGNLTLIPQGDTDSTRDGDAVKLLKIQLWAQAQYADATNALRLIIFRWNQDTSSAGPASIGDILQSVSPYSPYNRDNERARKFDVIYDHLFALCNVGPGTEKVVLDKAMKSIIAFQATSTAGTGHLFYGMVSDSSAVPHVGMQFVFRTYYTDS